MSELIYGIYQSALDCGISQERFWNLSIPDITETMESIRRQEERRVKQELMNLHFLARDIGQFTALAVHGSREVEIMELWDFFPGLFGQERKETEKKTQEQQMAVYKAQMRDFAYRFNRARGGKGDGRQYDTGNAPGNH